MLSIYRDPRNSARSSSSRELPSEVIWIDLVNPTDEEKQFVKSRIAVYKYPRWVEFVSSLPKNDRGKIDRKQLKATDKRG